MPSIIEYFTQQLESLQAKLNNRNHSDLEHFESRLSVVELQHILNSEPFDLISPLKHFLSRRWNRLLNTNHQYLHYLNGPVNQFCITIAKHIAQAHYLACLMPTLDQSSDICYLTFSLDDPDLQWEDLILNDSHSALIHIRDVLSNAQLDGILKYNFLIDGEPSSLNPSETQRLLSRHPAVQRYYDALLSRALYRNEGSSCGAALVRLIEGLRAGGKMSSRRYQIDHFNGSEFNAGADANEAIVAFASFLKTLSFETRTQFLKSHVSERDNDGQVKDVSIKTYWNRLISTKQNKKDIIYCVELVAQELESLLDANSHLFDMISETSEALNQWAYLNEMVCQTEQHVNQKLQKIKRHHAYKFSVTAFEQTLSDACATAEFKPLLQDCNWLLNYYRKNTCSVDCKASIHLLFQRIDTNNNKILASLTKANKKIYQNYFMPKPCILVGPFFKRKKSPDEEYPPTQIPRLK